MSQDTDLENGQFLVVAGFHYRSEQFIDAAILEQRAELLIQKLECPIVFVVLNLDSNHGAPPSEIALLE
jgi:hypothetical protein